MGWYTGSYNLKFANLVHSQDIQLWNQVLFIFRIILMPQTPTPAITVKLPVCVVIAMVVVTHQGTLFPVNKIFMIRAGGASISVRGWNTLNFTGRSYENGSIYTFLNLLISVLDSSFVQLKVSHTPYTWSRPPPTRHFLTGSGYTKRLTPEDGLVQ